MMAKTVLIIAYYFPPLGMGGVQRMSKLAKYLPQNGYEVCVLTVKPIRYAAYDVGLLEEMPMEVGIFRSGSTDPARIGRFLPFSPVMASAVKRTANDKGKRLWPDSKIGWRRPALRLAHKILADHPIDIILSSSPPMTGHLVAMELKREFSLPWVADFRDVWEVNPPERLYADRDRVDQAYHLLDEIAASADAVTRVNDSIGRTVFASAVTIMGGFDPDDFSGIADRDEHFTLCYVGTVGPLAPMECFFHAAAEASKADSEFAAEVRFRFIGINDADAILNLAAGYGLKERISIMGYLPHRQALTQAVQASVYVLSVPREHPIITTGKLFDYLALPGPILAAAPSGGEAEKIINAYNAGLCSDPDDVSKLADNMLKLFLHHRRGLKWEKRDAGDLTRPEAARQFAALFDRVISG